MLTLLHNLKKEALQLLYVFEKGAAVQRMMQHFQSVLVAVCAAFTAESVPSVAATETLDIRSAVIKEAVSMEGIRARLFTRGTCASTTTSDPSALSPRRGGIVALPPANVPANVFCTRNRLSITVGPIAVPIVEATFSALVSLDCFTAAVSISSLSTDGDCRTQFKISGW